MEKNKKLSAANQSPNKTSKRNQKQKDIGTLEGEVVRKKRELRM
jgi:hypothetical protein